MDWSASERMHPLGVRKFRKDQGAPKTPRDLLRTFDSWISSHTGGVSEIQNVSDSEHPSPFDSKNSSGAHLGEGHTRGSPGTLDAKVLMMDVPPAEVISFVCAMDHI